MIEDRKYTSRDIVAIRNDIMDYIKATTTKWSDFNESDLGMIYVEVLAGVSDMLNYYLDNQALETYLDTAKQPKNIKRILENYNYKIESVGSAKGEVVFALRHVGVDAPYTPIEVPIPKYTVVSTANEPFIEYVTLEECMIKGGEEEVIAPVMQGNLETLEVPTKDIKEYYKYYLPDHKIPFETVVIQQGEEKWEQIEDAFLEIYGGKKYSVHSDPSGSTYIMFTYDWSTYLPSDDEEIITITYIKSMGKDGLVPPKSLNIIVDEIYDELNEDISHELIVTNDDNTYGAFDEVDLVLAKANARNFIKTMGRYITLQDYDAGIKKEPYVLRAQTMDWHEGPEFVDKPNLVRSWVVTTDLAKVSEVQLTELEDKIMEKGVATTQVEVRSAEFVEIPIRVKFTVRGQGVYRENILSRVNESLLSEFDNMKMDYGEMFDKQRIASAVYRISEDIKEVDVEGFEEPLFLSRIQFPLITDIKAELEGDYFGKKTYN